MRGRIPLEREPSNEGIGWGSQVTGLTAVALFLFLVGSVAWLSSAKRQQELLAAKPNAHGVGAPSAAGMALEALRADFLEAFSKALDDASVDHALDAENGTVRLGPGAVSFKVGKASLSGKPLAVLDRVGALLARAAECLPKAPSDYQAPSVMNQPAGLRACASEAELAGVELACKPEWKKLAFEAVLVEGHADARPYAAGGRAFKDNLNLSSARGETVMRRLYACAPELASFTNPRGLPAIGVAAHSTQRPMEIDDPLGEGNRRVELRFLLASPPKAAADAKVPAAPASASEPASAPEAPASALSPESAPPALGLPAKTLPKAPMPESDLLDTTHATTSPELPPIEPGAEEPAFDEGLVE